MNMFAQQLSQIRYEIKQVIIGKDEIIDLILSTLLAKGHVLLDDIPGVGKTSLALAFAKTMSLQYNRVQFTPDVMPSDVTGFSMYNKKSESFEYQQGAVMCNLFLADEINRTSPKTQAALLEAMEEQAVTVDRVTRKLPEPFFVIATENPLGSIGTQRLPESQLDRFMVQLSMGYPDLKSEIEILKNETKDTYSQVAPVVTLEQVMTMQEECQQIYVSDSLYEYIANLVWATRKNEELTAGISPRGSKALLRMSRAYAYLNGRDYVIPEDVQKVFPYVGGHRVVISPRAKATGKLEIDVVREILKQVAVPVQ